MNLLAHDVVDALASALEKEPDEIAKCLEQPPNSANGDFAFPCFTLAKEWRKAPPVIAQELAAKMAPQGNIEKIETAGGYLNFYLYHEDAIVEALETALDWDEGYGSSDEGNGKVITIDYSSPNIAKPFTYGHLRSTVIGQAIANLWEYLGYEVVRINHLGDWGTQFGMMISAYEKWGDKDKLIEGGVHYLVELYVRYNAEAKNDPALHELAKQRFKELEEGEAKARTLWSAFRQISLKEFERIYEMLGVHFDHYTGEAFYNNQLEDTIDLVATKPGLVESEGASVVPLEQFNMPPCLICKSDGATTYATRDLAAAIYRHATFGFTKNIYVVGAPQELHFQQVFKVLELMERPWAKKCVFVPFGYVFFWDESQQKFVPGKTREGTIVLLEEVLNKAVEKALDIIKANEEKKMSAIEDKESVATMVGIGAIIFNDLSNKRIKDVRFKWEDILNFDGETGPYCQWTHVRLSSILRVFEEKFGHEPGEPELKLLTEDHEFQLAKMIANYPEVIRQAANEYEPSILTTYLVRLAQQVNVYLYSTRILNEDNELLSASRAALVRVLKNTLASGLTTLGLELPEQM